MFSFQLSCILTNLINANYLPFSLYCSSIRICCNGPSRNMARIAGYKEVCQTKCVSETGRVPFLFPLRRQNVLEWEPHGARVGRLQAVWQQPPQLLQAGAKMRLQMTSWSHGGHLFYYFYFYYYCFFVSWWLPLPSCWLAPGRLVLLLLLPRMSTMVLVAVILLAGHSLLLLGDFPLGLLSTTSRILCTW